MAYTREELERMTEEELIKIIENNKNIIKNNETIIGEYKKEYTETKQNEI